MNKILARLPVAIVFASACALSTGAVAQSDAKRALAVKLAQMQQKAESAGVAEQLTNNAVQPLLISWSQRLDQTVPPARQKEVRDKLDVELKKFIDTTQKTIEAQTPKSAEAALVPIFMDKLTEDEMRSIIAYLELPVAAKFQALGVDATEAWAKRVFEATKPAVESSIKSFDSAASRIVGASGGAAPKK
ncbi:MAG: hypothetical protein LBQ32_05315 [Burkholderiaceae bacterium]|jgi:hypothetical protein|nr:hypothetical protein [Burkholderiaceae bacterium]